MKKVLESESQFYTTGYANGKRAERLRILRLIDEYLLVSAECAKQQKTKENANWYFSKEITLEDLKNKPTKYLSNKVF